MVDRRGKNMTTVALTALFSSIALIVVLVLFDSGLKFVNVVKDIRRSAQANRYANATTVSGLEGAQVVTSRRIRDIAFATTTRRVPPQRVVQRIDVPAACPVAA